MPKVFVNFRGKDQAGYAALLDRELTEQFGAGAVFLSSRSILPGEDFVTEILNNVRSSSILLAVIGWGWLDHARLAQQREAEGTVDWVRLEIAEALKNGVRVVPVLVEGVSMPPETELPADIAAMARCQYLRLHHRNVDHDLARILEEVQTYLPPAPRTRLGQVATAPSEPIRFRLAGPPHGPCHVGVLTGSIRRVRSVAIWVNSENTDMVMSRFSDFSVSAIIRYWGARRDPAGQVVEDVIGVELAARIGDRRPVVPATAVVTSAGALAESHNVRNIIHVAAVQGEPGAGFRQVRDVGACVTAVLAEAERLAIDESSRTILLPLLGVGMGGGEVLPTVAAMVFATVDHLMTRPDTGLRGIYFLAYTEAELMALQHVLATTLRLVPAPPDA